MPLMTGQSQIKLMSSNHKITKLYCENEAIYSAGNIVTYYVDGVAYQEELDEGANCLNPTVVNPTKSGANFLGWREDKTVSSTVLTEKVMSDEPITLYAVFKYHDLAGSVDTGDARGELICNYIAVNANKHSKITLTQHSTDGMCFSRLYDPNGNEVLYLHVDSGLSKSTTNIVTGTYRYGVQSNYDWSSNSATITVTGKIVVG